jgi:hypothetical protein
MRKDISAGSEKRYMTGQMWLFIGVTALAGIALGGFVLTRTNWFKIRKYAIDTKRVYDKHKGVQEKVEAAQTVNEHTPQPIRQKVFRELIEGYKALVADLDQVKAKGTVESLHAETLTMNREMIGFYQALLTGKFNARAMQERQKKLMVMQNSIQAKTEKIFGSLKKEAKKK